MNSQIYIDRDRIASFCQKWRIRELALFGSVLRDDFNPGSDVDVLVSFSPEAPWDYFDWPDMLEELKSLFGHDVDLVEKESRPPPLHVNLIIA